MKRLISFPDLPPGWSRQGAIAVPDRAPHFGGAGAIAAAGQRVKPINPTSVSGCVAYWSMLDTSTYTITLGSPDTITSITNQLSSTAWNTAAVTNFPEYVASAINGHPAMYGSSTSRGIRSTEAAVLAPFAGTDTALTIIAVVQPTQVGTANTTIIGAGNSGVNGNDTWRFGTNTTSSGRWVLVKVDNSGAAGSNTSTLGVPTLAPHIITWRVFGTTLSFYEDFKPAGLNLTCDTGAMTSNRVGIMCRPDTSPDNFFDGYWGAAAIFNVALSTANIRSVEQFLFDAWF